MATMQAHRAWSGRVTMDMARLLQGAFDALRVWQDRVRQRRHLASLDDRLLRDMGLTRGLVSQESDKPFWQK